MNKRIKRKGTAYERMMMRVDIPRDKSKCWLWTGPVNNAGYGMIRGNDGVPKMTTVHRVAGIHKGLSHRKEIQHTCLTKNCVNPDHLVNGDPMTRMKRILNKHGNHWQKPKNPIKVCEHCGGESHIVWFSRKHGDCYTYKPKRKV
jgi:hypothetical protein